MWAIATGGALSHRGTTRCSLLVSPMSLSRYEILSTIGVGATSRVDKARDTLIGRTVALKTFGNGFSSEELQKQFLREAQIIGRVSHPNIVSLYDVGTNENGAPFLVMEYVAGKTLETILAEGSIPFSRAALWAADLATALNRAHRAGIIHGDIKPANIFVTDDGNVKLGDFGVGRFATQVSGTGCLVGTPAYISPEQILGNSQDHRSDLFSLGVVLYQMTTGVRPFNGSSIGAVCAQIVSTEPPPPSQHKAELPAAFDRIVMRCLSKDPAARYAAADSLAASLYALSRSEAPKPVIQRRVSWWERPLSSRDIWISAAALVLIAVSVPAAGLLRKRVLASQVHAAAEHSASVPTPVSKPVLSSQLQTAEPPAVSIHEMSIVEFPKVPPPIEKPEALPAKKSLAHAHVSSNHKAPAAAMQPRPSSPSAPGDSSATGPTNSVTATLPVSDHSVGTERSSLGIEVVSAVDNEILAVYADQQLIATAPLAHADADNPIHLAGQLRSGAHQFRVVLYRPDQSLQTQKEGLAEIRPGNENTLKIRVIRRSKLFVKHEASLEIVWPGSPASTAKADSAGSLPIH